MRLLIAAFLLVFLIPQSAHAEQTLEEKIITGFYGSFYAAEAFDDTCNDSDSQLRSDMHNKENVRWHGNMEMLVARIAKLQMIQNPELELETALDYLKKSAYIIKARATKALKEKGCQSDVGEAAAKALQLFRVSTPEATYDIINREIRSRGGKVTDISK